MRNNLFILLFHNPWDWTADFANQTAYKLALTDFVICILLNESKSIKEYLFAEKKPILFRKDRKNLYVYTPLYILPLRRFWTIERLNLFLNIFFLKIITRLVLFPQITIKKYLWVFYPGHQPIVQLFDRSFSVIYDCVDFFDGKGSHFPNPLNLEKKLILSSNFFFVNSRSLFKIHKNLRIPIMVPQGFNKSINNAIDLIDTRFTNKKIIGYVGGINHRLDYDLLYQLVLNNPKYLFVFVGPIQPMESIMNYSVLKKKINKLLDLDNFLLFQDIAKDRVFSFITKFDIGIIPYDKSMEFNKFSFPMKIFEYFYAGIPVVSTHIEELEYYRKYVKIADNLKDWQESIQAIFSQPWPERFKKEQKNLCEANSWERKISYILRELEK